MSISLLSLKAPNGVYDIVKDYKWSLNNGNLNALSESQSATQKNNVPIIELIEYEQDVAGLYAQLSYWYRVASNRNNSATGRDVYKGLYSANPTDTKFILPYYEDYHHLITQRWAKNKGLFSFSTLDKGMKALSMVKQALGAAGTYVNQPQVWEGISEASYTISFYLYNTDEINVESYKNGISNSDYVKNKMFIDRLIMSTLHSQETSIEILPPALFEVNVPGIRYSPAAVINSLIVTNIGQINALPIEGGSNINVPDAYQISIGISELISESRQIYDTVYKNLNAGSRVKAIEKASSVLNSNQEEEEAAKIVEERDGIN